MSLRPNSPQARGVFIAEVLANRRLCEEHYLLRVGLSEFPPSRPGQFVQLQCRHIAEQQGPRVADWPQGAPPRLRPQELKGQEPLLRRPFSLAGRRDLDGSVELDIIYRMIGTGTRWLSGVSQGERLSILGPLGSGFTVRDDRPAAVLVGGGVGIGPMIYLAEALAAAGKQTVAFTGARTADLLPLRLLPDAEVSKVPRPAVCVTEFAMLGTAAVIATDDGSLGFAGLVSEAFANWLDGRKPGAGEMVVYSCGPEAMMRAVAELSLPRGIECQLAMERYMACGMGTCQSCVVKVRADSEAGWTFKLCCADGPVFDAADILW